MGPGEGVPRTTVGFPVRVEDVSGSIKSPILSGQERSSETSRSKVDVSYQEVLHGANPTKSLLVCAVTDLNRDG